MTGIRKFERLGMSRWRLHGSNLQRPEALNPQFLNMPQGGHSGQHTGISKRSYTLPVVRTMIQYSVDLAVVQTQPVSEISI